MAEQEPVDAATYAAHLDRLDRIGREALAAEPAEAIALVREANALVGELLPMHRRLMDELAHHREALQAACDELAVSDDGPDEGPDDGTGEVTGDPDDAVGMRPRGASDDRLDRLEGYGDDDSGVPF